MVDVEEQMTTTLIVATVMIHPSIEVWQFTNCLSSGFRIGFLRTGDCLTNTNAQQSMSTVIPF